MLPIVSCAFPGGVRSHNKLAAIARKLRLVVLEMAKIDPNIHVGASLSVLDVLVTLYFGRGLRYDGSLERDWVILSKGHAVPALYAILAETGVLQPELLMKIRSVNGLEGHPSRETPCIDVSTGSLGQGLSIAAGIAYALKLRGVEDRYRVYTILGDGELDEGQVWEAAATIAHLKLRSVVAIVDVNGYQLDGPTEIVKYKGNIASKWEAFGWKTIVIDGHDYEMILSALDEADRVGGPIAVIAYTRRGRGVGFLEARGAQHISK